MFSPRRMNRVVIREDTTPWMAGDVMIVFPICIVVVSRFVVIFTSPFDLSSSLYVFYKSFSSSEFPKHA